MILYDNIIILLGQSSRSPYIHHPSLDHATHSGTGVRVLTVLSTLGPSCTECGDV